mmetsp:Transcript_10759/g.31534  ORF Transcript_10759/g.31534 Transcript_10759/m.31534 type:complete len:146 (-) Transcript_10759:1629-2066(-)
MLRRTESEQRRRVEAQRQQREELDEQRRLKQQRLQREKDEQHQQDATLFGGRYLAGVSDEMAEQVSPQGGGSSARGQIRMMPYVPRRPPSGGGVLGGAGSQAAEDRRARSEKQQACVVAPFSSPHASPHSSASCPRLFNPSRSDC